MSQKSLLGGLQARNIKKKKYLGLTSTWKNAIPKEIPAIMPRLASIVVVARAKQP